MKRLKHCGRGPSGEPQPDPLGSEIVHVGEDGRDGAGFVADIDSNRFVCSREASKASGLLTGCGGPVR